MGAASPIIIAGAGAAGRPRRVAHPTSRVLALLWLLVALATASAAPAPAPEYRVKAAFLLNFAQFVEWPTGSFANDRSPIVVGVLGDDPFGALLDKTFEGETVQHRPLVIRRSHQVEDVLGCHMVFISSSERQRIGEVLASFNGRGILTVSDVENFAVRGGMINFYLDANRVRFEINPAAADREGIRIRAELLRRAKIVQ